jgi:YgiT-type zinc finger domain-containing protein
MKCAVCGAELRATSTDLPFKVRETAIVIVKDIPVLQCRGCPLYLLEDRVLGKVDEILAHMDGAAELEIVRYAA